MSLRPHDPRWSAEFEQVRQRIHSATGVPSERIEHVGSTSVPGLVAKPILDIDVGVTPEDEMEALVAALERIGFLDRGLGGGGIGRLVVWEPEPDVRTVHVHVIPHESVSWRRDLAFRDALRSDESLRVEYGFLKMTLAERFADDRTSYREAKGEFVAEVVARLVPAE